MSTVNLTTLDDTMVLSATADTITAGAVGSLNADDTIDGGAGDDVLNILGAQTVTFNATTLVNVENVIIRGGVQDITLHDASVDAGQIMYVDASASADRVRWVGQAETDGSFSLLSGAGNDTIYGGDGADTLNGGEGNDYLYGRDGNDVIYGGDGNDGIFGDEGNDTIYGGSGNDTFVNRAGDDLFYGGDGNDWVIEGNGNDTVYGGAGDDTLNGGDDNDLIYGEADNDYVRGQDGADTLYGGDGADTLSGYADADVLIGGAGNDIFRDSASNLAGDTILDFSVGDSIQVTGGVDLSSLDGTAATNTIDTGAGLLTLTGIGSAYNFSAVYSGSTTTISIITAPTSTPSPEPQVTISPTVPSPDIVGDGTIVATTYTNTSIGIGDAYLVQDTGNNGNTVLASLPGRVTLLSQGPEQVQSARDAQASLQSMIAGKDTAAEQMLLDGLDRFFDGMNGASLLDVRLIDIGLNSGTSVNAPLVLDGSESASAQNDAFVIDFTALPEGTGLQLNNIEFASIIGSANVVGGPGSGFLIADDASQAISMAAGDDVVMSGAGDDTVFGGDGADLVYGNQGHDLIYGNQSDDMLYAGQGEDTGFGGQGADILFGNSGSDMLLGNLDADTLYGNQDNDSLFGGGGDDLLHGGQGDDFLVGGIGQDTLNGGLGNDTIVTGEGADLIVFNDAGGNDVITDFDVTMDRIQIGIADGAGASVEVVGNVIFYNGGSIELAGVLPESITDLIFVA